MRGKPVIYRKSGGTKGHLIAPEEGIPRVKGYDIKKTAEAIRKLSLEIFSPVTIEYMTPRKRR